ncbi:MAG TPA: SDR family oxidoreductase [Spirochaetia bacterium]|nr:SDR family oxidoreductase [Spirochaetia bacterium]
MILDDFSLQGEVAVVTGGNRGLGRGMAVALAEAGADIVSVQTGAECLETRELVEARGRKCYAFPCDLATMNDAGPLVAEIEEKAGPVSILVNNAGIQRRHKSEVFPQSDWDLVLQIQLRAVFLLCQGFGRKMLERSHGKIINIASLVSFSGGLYVPAYASAKGAVAQLTKALANEWASRGVNVNAIAPGYMATEMNTALMEDPTRSAQILDRIPAKRWGVPADMGGTVVYLASRASAYVNGVVFPVDGGWMAR